MEGSAQTSVDSDNQIFNPPPPKSAVDLQDATTQRVLSQSCGTDRTIWPARSIPIRAPLSSRVKKPPSPSIPLGRFSQCVTPNRYRLGTTQEPELAITEASTIWMSGG